ncbi:retron St85 family RNA-directed DNA polymerase [Duganella sp. HH101]|uniref:retron St85 family RNA-directed DNA polymerase n=1 Tax=Duganella sp. HH101 TaxID=1781066 RepID=UPI00089391EE|nr:retron St85 family RNA-directed DNA polymerase [Duganella sp. HH101]OFA03723.1 reverse transcriptase (RNA-dependent DNA polymerase) [Duganella sp. HH101]
MSSKLLTQIRAGTGLPITQIERLIVRAPYTYKIYTIPKRSGGERIIAQPARETKLIQNWLVENAFGSLPIHKAATAYRSGASIKHNAEMHAKSRYMVKLDFKNFFPSITYNDLVAHFSRHLSEQYEIEDIKRMAIISCLNIGRLDLALSVGSPASPCLSNTVMYELDNIIQNWCDDKHITYTRYADDLTFSTNQKDISTEVEIMIASSIATVQNPRLSINSEKTVHLSKKFKRMVTGVVINSQNNISLGRDRKREISALIHKFSIGILSPDEAFRTQGLLGFAKDIEPDFVVRMDKKYGNQLLEQIFKLRKVTEI